MKDLAPMWNNPGDMRYSAVNMDESKDVTNNHPRRPEIDNIEANFDRCETVNKKINGNGEFSFRSNAVLNRLFERRKKGQIGRQPKSKCFYKLLFLCNYVRDISFNLTLKQISFLILF